VKTNKTFPNVKGIHLERLRDGVCPVCARSPKICTLFHRMMRVHFQTPLERADLVITCHLSPCPVPGCNGWPRSNESRLCEHHQREKDAGNGTHWTDPVSRPASEPIEATATPKATRSRKGGAK